ncbi:hypothetical protein ASPWEDRAFT_41880 [Aspergillus wentii DTO 134E9]|uniref:Uncharacterized protein n=1 Tax=Aspergillus wentii DTO 134E9 TaxID=1073089 RepID=A0A1L9RGK8_ASPWE|nr:uncharacterized protein ASPWEDRAFT_41880 [Aspergillus wentii DTO 134E9]KAI9927773.1 hypothetical protein MW887_002625 [Aspergillus wentii]OJJ33987.1 hypothetical protein ASPWEDRAFT_41880 [Aspergillus wentii DTO 134E9]
MMFARSFAFRAFSRQCPRSAASSRVQFSSPTWRYFSSSAFRAKTPNLRSTANPSPARATSPPEETLKFAGKRPQGFVKLERKVAKEGELLLFKRPSHRAYILGAYGVAAFCFAYSVYNSNIVFRDPIVPLPMWQQGLFGGICIMMSAMGTVFLFKTGGLINSIKAIRVNGQAYLRFNVRRIIPFRRAYEFDALPRQIAFSRRLVISPDSHRNMQSAGLSNGGPSEVSFFKSPTKKISILLWRAFRSVRQIFTSEDFILLEVEGQKGTLRMDSGGFLSKDFLVVGDPFTTH